MALAADAGMPTLVVDPRHGDWPARRGSIARFLGLDAAKGGRAARHLPYTSSHSRRTPSARRRSAGVPSNTIRPWPIT